ncbi:succinate dehydrogenase assembly factor 2 [Tulasnella sp. 424]|nr:succinate dehydrogenase assembly factor 2 [Tulasnella sp. 424]KAG8974258.1 succinate dehydrogenase assembly factor 2 [Tulasnella sp. 425]
MSLLRFSRIASRPVLFRTPARLISSSGVRNADPFPLPLQSHQPSTQNDSEVAKNDDSVPPEFMPKPLARHGEDVETLRARLVYQSRKRGNLEMDLIFSTFAKENMATMSEAELKEFDKLMDEPDWDVYYWCTRKREPPALWADSPLLERLRKHAKNEGRVVRRMPDLSKS